MTTANFTHREKAIEMAREIFAQKPVYIDTETTGLDKNAEIVEIAIVDHDGKVLMEDLIRPSVSIPPETSRVHHITDEMVKNAKTWPVLWPTIRSNIFGRPLAFYNEVFDMRMIRQTHQKFSPTPWRENFKTFCVMKLYAQFVGDWDSYHNRFRYFKLEQAGKTCGLTHLNTHRAAEDTLLTRELLHFIANQS
jgi:DNA polymerase-3 subunit epsilon